jgi:SAM-dependent methyltransferase
MLSHAKDLMSSARNVYFHQSDGVQLPIAADENLDLVYSSATFAHLDTEDMFQYLLEAHRVLRPGGWLYFDICNLAHPDMFRIWRVDVQAKNLLDSKSLGRPRGYTSREIRLYLDEIGFELLDLAEERLLRVLARKGPQEAHSPDDGLAPFGYVGFPQNASVVRGHLEVSGWALDAVRSIEITINDRAITSGKCGEERPELVGLFPRYPEARTAGFRIPVATDDLAPGKQVMRVVAVDDGGTTNVLTGNHLGFTWEPTVSS